MRSSARFAIISSTLAVAVAGLVGCASPQDKATCYPVAGWSTPVFRCAAPTPPPVVAAPVPEPTPEPTPAPEPEPEIVQRAQLQNDRIDLSETVQFETDSAVLVERSKRLLDQVANELEAHPEVKRVLIEGYTDAVASKGHNQKLSDDRVAAVKSYLVEKGISANRLRTRGFGERKPIGSNKTEEGRAKNRRVEFKVIERAKK